MKTPSIYARVNIKRQELYKKYVLNSPFAKQNKYRIDYVLDKVYRKQLKIYNSNEQKVIDRLTAHDIPLESQKLIPILSEGGKLEHLYIADIVVGNTIIEVDGPQHQKTIEYDNNRDKLTSELGYTTIRIPTSDLSIDTIDNYIQQLL